LGALVPESTHIIEPVAQDCLPVWQGALDGVHAVFSVQVAHMPPLQTMPVPHDVPSFTLVVFMHSDAPVEHSVTPVWQALLLGVHTSPVLHVLQPPALHTRFVPQLVPFGRFVIRSVQAGIPAAQVRLPAWQGAVGGTQVAPPAQATHPPLLHTWLFPHVAPSVALPVCIQADMPDAHDVLPALQVVPVGTQSWPAAHERQVPPEQTLLAPHAAPSVSAAIVSEQDAVPAAQSSAPTWQALVGTQADPFMQALHSPLLHTIPLVLAVAGVAGLDAGGLTGVAGCLAHPTGKACDGASRACLAVDTGAL
jgi:hypothetical protein